MAYFDNPQSTVIGVPDDNNTSSALTLPSESLATLRPASERRSPSRPHLRIMTVTDISPCIILFWSSAFDKPHTDTVIETTRQRIASQGPLLSSPQEA
jgi:hypothetical protein